MMVYPLHMSFQVGPYQVEAMILESSYTWTYKDASGSGFSHSDYHKSISVEDLIKEVHNYVYPWARLS
jgi:hypothetical protein